MSDLPTLYVDRDTLDDLRPSDRLHAFVAAGVVAREVAYVPASSLDAANEALRQDRAEVERLRDIIQHVVAGMGHSGSEAPESLPCNESCIGCDEDTIGEGHRPDLPPDRCADHPAADSDADCWRCLLTAALAATPKEGT